PHAKAEGGARRRYDCRLHEIGQIPSGTAAFLFGEKGRHQETEEFRRQETEKEIEEASMKRMIENITGNYAASASVVDGTLIISLPDAITPVVWRFALGQAKASALEVRPQDDGTFMLLLKTPRG